MLSYEVFFSLIDAYTFRVIILIIFWHRQMPQMLMITVKCALMVGHFEIDEIEVFVDITPSTINNAKVSSGLSGVYWQQPQLMGLVNFATVETSPIKISARTRAGQSTSHSLAVLMS